MPLLSMALAACLAVGAGSDHILAGDLASGLPGDGGAGSGNSSGARARTRRVAHFPRVRSAHAGGTFRAFGGSQNQAFCVERPVAPLDPDRLLEAMKSTLPQAHIDILDYSRQPAPPGELRVSAAGIARPGATDGALWTGSVRYAGNRRFLIWARVRVTAGVRRVVAMADLKPGQPIEPRPDPGANAARNSRRPGRSCDHTGPGGR